ncbi:hypothetical protein PanWU01x14_256440 [Parasponia andersonii]|uniref:Uncharacterized protein n=1 Tax=Parasponia andersonii TaxID=3476 RepID=A0A2P5BAF2_PARAD|nr:hypothetical protein PanWU01x14_256440 [Parasponia andersonii]
MQLVWNSSTLRYLALNTWQPSELCPVRSCQLYFGNQGCIHLRRLPEAQTPHRFWHKEGAQAFKIKPLKDVECPHQNLPAMESSLLAKESLDCMAHR